MKKKIAIVLMVLLVLVVYNTICVFVVQPLGAVPNGVTVVMLRTGTLKFVDSADAMCMRIDGGVSILCRLSSFSAVTKGTILFRLPYSEYLYLLSTNGAKFEK